MDLLSAAADVLTREKTLKQNPRPTLSRWDMAASTGIEPAISSVTDWRALRCSTKLYKILKAKRTHFTEPL